MDWHLTFQPEASVAFLYLVDHWRPPFLNIELATCEPCYKAEILRGIFFTTNIWLFSTVTILFSFFFAEVLEGCKSQRSWVFACGLFLDIKDYILSSCSLWIVGLHLVWFVLRDSECDFEWPWHVACIDFCVSLFAVFVLCVSAMVEYFLWSNTANSMSPYIICFVIAHYLSPQHWQEYIRHRLIAIKGNVPELSAYLSTFWELFSVCQQTAVWLYSVC